MAIANRNPAIIAVMGVTGVGKSYFIGKTTGERVQVGDSLESCTSWTQSSSLPHLCNTLT